MNLPKMLSGQELTTGWPPIRGTSDYGVEHRQERWVTMNPDAQMMVPISKANKDFSRVMHMVDSYGRVVILKDNKPKYLLIDLEQEALIYDLTEKEKLEITSKRIMRQCKPALEKLAEYENTLELQKSV